MTFTPALPTAQSLQPHIEDVLCLIEKNGAGGLGVAETCLFIEALKMSVETKASEGNFYLRKANGQIDGFAPGVFRREFGALSQLCNNLNFSDAWRSRVQTASWKLAQKLAVATPFSQLEQRVGPDKGRRMGFLESVAADQAALFSDKQIRFSTPTMRFTTASGLKGAFNFDSDRRSEPSLDIGEFFLVNDPMADGVKTIWHEQLHGFHFQLASMFLDDKIPASHALYDDAKMLAEKLVHHASIPSTYPPQVYRSDVEERLCHASQDQFIAMYATFSAGFQNGPRP